MEKETAEKYRESGNVLAEAMALGRSMAKPGTNLLDIAEAIESHIKKNGCGIAFPVNLSLNETAAHYTPDSGDSIIFGEGDMLKIDIGVHKDGYIADSASTTGGDKKLIEASEKALQNALKLMRPGVRISEVSSTIQETIESFGFRPVSNLTGHLMERYELHAGVEIPNVKVEWDYELKEGQTFAVEPFATDGVGRIRESSPELIFMYLQDKPVRLQEARKILQLSRENYRGLPFAKRWLNFSPVKVSMSLRQLVSMGALKSFPLLKEAPGKFVSQAEHTVIVADNPIVTTKTD